MASGRAKRKIDTIERDVKMLESYAQERPPHVQNWQNRVAGGAMDGTMWRVCGPRSACVPKSNMY